MLGQSHGESGKRQVAGQTRRWECPHPLHPGSRLLLVRRTISPRISANQIAMAEQSAIVVCIVGVRSAFPGVRVAAPSRAHAPATNLAPAFWRASAGTGVHFAKESTS